MKRPTMLVQAVLQQGGLDLDLSVERDIAVMRHRCEHEGFSFLTITLPVLSDHLERGLESGTFTCPSSFRRHGKLPCFLKGFFQRVFDKDGRLLPDACPESVFYIRQICRFMKKLKIGCSPEREVRAAKQYQAIEGELYHATTSVKREDPILDEVSAIIWSQVFPEIDSNTLVCSHGPGATAERRKANERYDVKYWNDRSELTFPSDLHCFANYGIAASVGINGELVELAGPRMLSVSEEIPVRVVFVPKTQLTPRVIAIEPSHMQYMQQSLKDYSYRVLEAHKLTRQSIRFARQEPNQRLAYSSSIDRRLATLDLKDASDRVHLSLVQRIFKNSGILEYLEDCRSLSAVLPDGTNLVLNKFASMGSAMCFPVEAMVFYTLIQSAMHGLDGIRPSSKSIAKYSRSIDIYGDDIIVPVKYADAVVHYLEAYALKVNVSKSFKEGNFRESCGADFFKGYMVNPVYARQIPYDDARRWTPDVVMAWNATADLFYIRGMWHAAQAIRDVLSSVVRSRIPRSRVFGAGLVHFSYLFTTDLRFDGDLQCWKQRRISYQPTKKKDDIDGNENACLLKWGIDVHQASGRDECERYVHSSLHPMGSPGGDLPMGDPSLGMSEDWLTGGTECARGVQRALHLLEAGRGLTSPLRDVRASDILDAHRAERVIRDYWADHCRSSVSLDPLGYLEGRSSGLDFSSSVKRGVFKSKRRWVSLAG